MTHRLYDETCLERWKKRKAREAAENLIAQRLREERDARWRSHHREDATTPRSRDDDGIVSMPNVVPTWDPAPTTIDPNPSTIDPGGGSSGGGGATGEY